MSGGLISSVQGAAHWHGDSLTIRSAVLDRSGPRDGIGRSLMNRNKLTHLKETSNYVRKYAFTRLRSSIVW